MLGQALDRVLATVRGAGGSIRLRDEASGELRLVASSRASENHAGPGPDCGTLAAWVTAHDEPLIIAEFPPADLPSADTLSADNPRDLLADNAFVGMPMRVGGRSQGVLSVFRTVGRPFELAEISLLSSVAEGLALAVENHRRSRLAAVLDERARTARELHDSVSQSLYSLTLFSEWGVGLLEANELEAVPGETSAHCGHCPSSAA